MDTNLSPWEMPRVAGWVMVAPAGTEIPQPTANGCTFDAQGWTDEWRMPDDIPVLAMVRSGCAMHDDVAYSVAFYGQGPAIMDRVAMVVDDSGQGVRLVMPDVTPCEHQRTAFHIADGNPPWYVLVAGYYGNPTEVRPYQPGVLHRIEM